MSKLSGSCPNCGSKLIYGEEEQSVMCYACDSLVNVADFATSKSTESVNAGGVSIAMPTVIGFDNPESGVVFMENFFENYAWDEYQRDVELEIAELASVINTNKMKNGAVAASWYLEYKGLATPVRKKIEGLALIGEKIGKAYNPNDLTEAYEFYDLYVNINKKLLAEKEAVFKRLENAIKFAERFKLEKAKLNEIRADIEDLKAIYDKDVSAVSDIREVPAYQAAQMAINAEKSRELAIRGIDAKRSYNEALQWYNSDNPDKSVALAFFERVRGYGDSVKYINSINQYFDFGRELYRFCGKYFIFKRESYVATLNVDELGKKKKKKDKSKEEQQEVLPKALALYEVVDGEPAAEPLIKGIAQMITCYGSRIYYFKLNQGIYSYDMYSAEETHIDEGKTEDYVLSEAEGYQCSLINNGKAFMVKKTSEKEPVVETEPKKKTKKEKKEPTSTVVEDLKLNPEGILVVDMANNVAKKTILSMKEIVFPALNKEGKKLLNLTNRLFYNYVEKTVHTNPKKKETSIELKQKFMVCDLETGESKEIFDENCEICTVYDNKVVYTVQKPNKYNRDIMVLDMATGKSNVIEKNVYKFFKVVEGKVYYLVGNDEYCPLVRNSFEGDAREEIMQNIEEIVCDIGGWLYVRKGSGANSLLVKVSADGKKRVVLCSHLKQFIGFYGNLIYYRDYYNNLRSVRIDGKNDISVAKNIEEVYPLDKNLYYTRKENVDCENKALSIYKMDKNGHNVRKVVFDVDKVGSDELNSKLYFKKDSVARYKVYEPKKEAEAVIVNYPLTKYYAMDMETEDVDLVLTVGLPHSKEYEKKGCFGRKKKMLDKIYEEITD